RTSPGPGSGVAISPTTRTLAGGPCRSYQAAFMTPPLHPPRKSAELAMSLTDRLSRNARSVAIDQVGLVVGQAALDKHRNPVPEQMLRRVGQIESQRDHESSARCSGRFDPGTNRKKAAKGVPVSRFESAAGAVLPWMQGGFVPRVQFRLLTS